MVLAGDGRSNPTPEARGGSRERQPHIRGQGQHLREPGCNSAGVAKRNYPTFKVRGSSREGLPHSQGAVGAGAQEGLEELLHVQGQDGQQ